MFLRAMRPDPIPAGRRSGGTRNDLVAIWGRNVWSILLICRAVGQPAARSFCWRVQPGSRTRPGNDPP